MTICHHHQGRSDSTHPPRFGVFLPPPPFLLSFCLLRLTEDGWGKPLLMPHEEGGRIVPTTSSTHLTLTRGGGFANVYSAHM